MTDDKPQGILHLFQGHLKAGITSVFGLVSGAVLMYLTPLVNNAVKPQVPVANFAVQPKGLTVTFNNRSVGATSGWWDFGDGSALEAFAPRQDTVAHTYPRVGSYSAKLTVRNLLGEENERVINIQLEPEAGNRPKIEEFEIEAMTPRAVPALFKVKAKVHNLDLCIWSLGEDRPLEISQDTSKEQERYVSIKEPGYYTFRLIGVSGKQTFEKSGQVFVGDNDQQAPPTAVLKVVYQAQEVQAKEVVRNVPIQWTADPSEIASRFAITRVLDQVHKGYEIAGITLRDPEYGSPNCPARDVELRVDPNDRTRYTISGTLVRPGQFTLTKQAPPSWLAHLALRLENRSKVSLKPMEEIPAELKVPGTTTIPVPKLTAGWQMQQKQVNLEIRDGGRVIWSGSRLPTNVDLTLGSDRYRLSAVDQGDRVVISVTDASNLRAQSK